MVRRGEGIEGGWLEDTEWWLLQLMLRSGQLFLLVGCPKFLRQVGHDKLVGLLNPLLYKRFIYLFKIDVVPMCFVQVIGWAHAVVVLP